MWCELQGQRPLLDAGVYLIVINRMEITSVLYRVDQACQPEQVSASIPGEGGGCSRGVRREPDQRAGPVSSTGSAKRRPSPRPSTWLVRSYLQLGRSSDTSAKAQHKLCVCVRPVLPKLPGTASTHVLRTGACFSAHVSAE